MSRALALRADSKIPLWAQIADILRRRIVESDTDLAGFTDTALATEFRVSPMTVRQAVQTLVDEGLLIRQRGRGTFLARRPVRAEIQSFEEYLAQWRFAGRDSSVEILARELVAANISLAGELGVAQGTLVAYIRRRRSIDGQPVALDHRYLPSDVNTLLTDEEILELGLWKAIERRASVSVRHANLTIRASCARDDEAELLQIPPGAPVLERGLQLETTTGRLILSGRTLYHPDRFIYAARFEVNAK
jgi:GntR family transcriptional regulator